MARKEGEPFSKWALTNWFVTGAVLIGCAVAQFTVDVKDSKVADVILAGVVVIGTASGAFGATNFEWKFPRSGGPNPERSAQIRDRFSLFGWSLLTVGAICTLLRVIFLP